MHNEEAMSDDHETLQSDNPGDSDFAKDVTVVHETVVLQFNKEDAQIARDWAKQKSQDKHVKAYNLGVLHEEHVQLMRIA